jgi:Na+-transporting methylmalonyl-CoA/oxaloacetate decarboxylase gamma subunit
MLNVRTWSLGILVWEDLEWEITRLENITQGFTICVVGMVILFASLGTLVLIIRVLDRVFRVKQPPHGVVEHKSKVSRGIQIEDQEKIRELAAALGVAICLLADGYDEPPTLGEALERPHGRWWDWRGNVDRARKRTW